MSRASKFFSNTVKAEGISRDEENNSNHRDVVRDRQGSCPGFRIQ
jgi:hypothetical protein